MSARFGKNKKMVRGTTLAVGAWALLLVLFASLAGCQQAETFTSGQVTESFIQDFNPKYLEVLWVVDDRSPMHNARAQIVSEATKFFSAIDGITARYRMGLVTTDMQFAKGALQPKGTRFQLNEGYAQSATERASIFSGLLNSLLNLNTGYQGRGLESAVAALEGEFGTEPGVPLVLIFISYAKDESGDSDAVNTFKNKFISIKGKAELVRTYAVNYKPLTGGIDHTTYSPELEAARCAQLYGNEIDTSPGTYKNDYFDLVTAMGGTTADLCSLSGFASQLDLTALTLKELQKSFILRSKANPDTLRVTIQRKDGSQAPIPEWSYNLPTNEIVFKTAPEEGTTIVVQYLPG